MLKKIIELIKKNIICILLCSFALFFAFFIMYLFFFYKPITNTTTIIKAVRVLDKHPPSVMTMNMSTDTNPRTRSQEKYYKDDDLISRCEEITTDSASKNNHNILFPILISMLTVLFGMLFPALAYRLNIANYNKDLFEKRYEVFLVIENVISEYFQPPQEKSKITAWHRNLIEKLDSVYRRNYFLFNEKTSKAIQKIRESIVKGTYGHDEIIDRKYDDSHEFLATLLDGQKLSEIFPELKISKFG